MYVIIIDTFFCETPRYLIKSISLPSPLVYSFLHPSGIDLCPIQDLVNLYLSLPIQAYQTCKRNTDYMVLCYIQNVIIKSPDSLLSDAPNCLKASFPSLVNGFDGLPTTVLLHLKVNVTSFEELHFTL